MSRCDTIASELDMDHVFMDFPTYTWIHLLVFPSLVLNALIGTLFIASRKILYHQLGWVRPMAHDPAETVANLVLETGLVMNYVGRSEGGANCGGDVAIFVWNKFPVVYRTSPFVFVKEFRVEIDLAARSLRKAALDNEHVSSHDCLALLMYAQLFLQHPKVHAFANWGVNLEPYQCKKNPSIAWWNAVTVAYNYFGYTGFPRSEWLGKLFGVLGSDNTLQHCFHTFDSSLKDGAPDHRFLSEMAQHSTFVRFAVQIRPLFIKEFCKHRGSLFPACDGEAVFVGTIIHSLDHANTSEIFRDPLWLDSSGSKYAHMAEAAVFTRFAYVDELRFLPFTRKFKDCSHPFYQAVYSKAQKLNLKFADAIETCIVR